MNVVTLNPTLSQQAPLFASKKVKAQPTAKTSVSFAQPSAAAWQARFLGRPSGVRFGQTYKVPLEEQLRVKNALTGWDNNETTLGVSYMPSKATVQALDNLLTAGQTVSDETQQAITESRVRAENIERLTSGRPTLTATDIADEAVKTQGFITDLTERVADLKQVTLTPANGFTPEATRAFMRFVSETAPALYSMGFPEAVDHAADVTQLGVKLARQKTPNASTGEMLQVAMVAWLHDPKVKSFLNLATHPAVASVVANSVLQQPTLSNLVGNVVTDDAAFTSDSFRDGVASAILTNSDSKFVLDMVLLGHMKSQLDEDSFAAISEAMQQRFSAPSQGKTPQAIPQVLLNKLANVRYPTDMRSVTADGFAAALNDAGLSGNPAEVFDAIISGDNQDRDAIEKLASGLAPTAIKNPQVSGVPMLAHQDESNALLASDALSKADQLLLSPHKIVATGRDNAAIGRLRSFNGSFLDNMAFLPKDAQFVGQQASIGVFSAMVKAADELTGNNTLANFKAAGTAEAVVAQWRELVDVESTWKGPKGDFANLDVTQAENKAAYDQLIGVIKKHYETMLKENPVFLGN